jgi:hypothetical protein
VTDQSGSKQGLWDEEIDEGRPTNPKINSDDLVEAKLSADDVPTETELETAIEHLRVSIPPAEAEPANHSGATGTMSPEAVDSVARFISDSGRISHNASRELDAPSRSLAALDLLDGPEYGAEPTDMRAPPQPPPTPGSVRPSQDHDLPSIVLGSQVSTRADTTERMQAIPLTHPLANSIAPGGSAVSTPPRPRRSSRWQVTLGVAAMLAIGFGASRFLQSRGEHHAASGLPGEDEEEELPARRDEAPAPAPPPVQSAVVGPTEEELALQQVAAAEAARQAEAEVLAAEAAAKKVADEARLAIAATEKVAAAKKAKSLRIGLGGARMLNRERPGSAEDDASGPDRAQVVAAMNAMTEQLKSCVGDEHGVADVTLTVRATGVVSHALVEGAFADSPQGSCIAKALRTTKLPAFGEPITRIEYPFQL